MNMALRSDQSTDGRMNVSHLGPRIRAQGHSGVKCWKQYIENSRT